MSFTVEPGRLAFSEVMLSSTSIELMAGSSIMLVEISVENVRS